MAGIAQSSIADWNTRVREGRAPAKGLIAVAFDQRNHGERLVDALGNEAWRQGNPRHAQDMFSVFREHTYILGICCCNAVQCSAVQCSLVPYTGIY